MQPEEINALLINSTFTLSLGHEGGENFYGAAFFITSEWALTAAHNLLSSTPNPVCGQMSGLADAARQVLCFNWDPELAFPDCDTALIRLRGTLPERIRSLPIGVLPPNASLESRIAFWRERLVSMAGAPVTSTARGRAGLEFRVLNGSMSADNPLVAFTDADGNNLNGLNIHSSHPNYRGISGGPVFDRKLEKVVAIASHQWKHGGPGQPTEMAIDLGQLCQKLAGPLRLELRSCFATISSDGGSVFPSLAAYLKWLWNETAYIDNRALQVADEEITRFRIDEVYTPLSMIVEVRGGHEDEEASAPLEQAMEQSRLLVTGDPGSGKSTFLHRVAFDKCQALQKTGGVTGSPDQPIPFLIRLADLASYIAQRRTEPNTPFDTAAPEWIAHYLVKAASDFKWGLNEGFLRSQMQSGCLLLFDGLDEPATQAERDNVTQILRNVALAFPNCRIVVTSRPRPLARSDIPGFATVQIAPFDEASTERFIAKWTQALRLDPDRSTRYREGLLQQIRGNPSVRRLAANPVMLTVLAALHLHQKRLPDQPVQLYEQILRVLVKTREARREKISKALNTERMLALMENLAFSMHADPKGKRVEIDRHEAAAVLGPEIRWVAADQCQAAAETLLRQEEMDSGILVSRGQMLRFWHLTFQEYLSARALRWRTEERKTLLFEQLKLYLPEWRQTVQFLTGLLLEQSQKSVDDFIRQALETLTSKTALAERARFASVIGRALKDLETDGYFPPVEMRDRYRNELKKIVEIFEKGAAQRFDFQLRLDAAEALGQGRDPRLTGENWVRFDGGTFSMGAQSLQTSQPNYDPDARVSESPVRRVRVDGFEIGVYPVTVQEYEQFIDDAGYARDEFWNHGGFHEWTQPFGWAHQRRYLNHPVVGVSWLEAQAYCQWRKCRLPSESQWEFAARGGRDGIRYPWGSQAPNAGLAAFRGSSGRRTPVGLFPEGATPQGLQDMAGNVWEWVRDSLGDQQRVTRGGCATDEAVDLRVSSRRVYPERGRFSSLGFRVAR